jgi:hypothetical protein
MTGPLLTTIHLSRILPLSTLNIHDFRFTAIREKIYSAACTSYITSAIYDMLPKAEPDELAQFLIVCLKNIKDANGKLIQVFPSILPHIGSLSLVLLPCHLLSYLYVSPIRTLLRTHMQPKTNENVHENI